MFAFASITVGNAKRLLAERSGPSSEPQTRHRLYAREAAIFLIVLSHGWMPFVDASDLLPDIIANVRANEELYRNIEIVASHTYRSVNPFIPNSQRFWDSSDASYRVVFQKDRFFFKLDRDTDVSKMAFERTGTLEGFDGEHTRIALKNSICNLHEGRVDDRQVFEVLPHTMPLRRMPSWVRFPLSTYLGGTKAIRAQGLFKDAHLDLKFVGEETKAGLRTYRLHGTFWTDGWGAADKKFTLHLWLAPDRNYLPIRLEWETFEMGGHPQHVSWIDDLREIAPGIWFPFRMRYEIYDHNWYAKDKSLIIDNYEEFEVKKAVLDPSYDDGLFRDIPFPDGAHVYVVKNRKTVRDYFQGGRKFAAPAPRRQWPVAWLAGSVMFAIGVGWVYFRRTGRSLSVKAA